MPKGLPQCRVRQRHAPDLDICAKVLRGVHEQDGYPVNWPANPGSWLDPSVLLTAWVAELDEQVVGHVGLARSEESDVAAVLWSRREGVDIERTAVVSRLFVAPEARGHGIGALLVARAVREARTLDLHPVLDVVASDTRAAALYEHLGWGLLATVEQQWGPAQTVTIRCYAAPEDP